MTSFLEFNARAELCRRLAKLEPRSKNVWLAEADRWTHLTHEAGATVEAHRAETAGTWCWEVSKRKHRAVNAAEMQFRLQGIARPADKDTFEEFLIKTLQ